MVCGICVCLKVPKSVGALGKESGLNFRVGSLVVVCGICVCLRVPKSVGALGK